MRTNPITSQNDQSIKLSVTVKRHLERKYNPPALEKIQTAIKRWIKADADRGIQTVHVEVDNSENETMKQRTCRQSQAKLQISKLNRPLTIYGRSWRRIT